MEFTELHKHRDFAQMYELALRIADIRQHPNFSKQQLKILDIQGGNGILGRLLYEFLGGNVEYTNVDNNGNVLTLSPPKTIKHDSNFLSGMLKGEEFDYIFCLNHDTHVSLPYFADTENHWSDNYIDVEGIRGIMTSIQLLQAAVFLRNGGYYIKGGGVITDDNISAFDKFFKRGGTGIQLKLSEELKLSDGTARDFASYDARRSVNYWKNLETQQYEKVTEEEIKKIINEAMEHYKTLRVVSFQKSEATDGKKSMLEKLVRYEQGLGSAYAQIEAMDRFGPS